MRSPLRSLVVTSFYFLILLGSAAHAEKSSVQSPPPPKIPPGGILRFNTEMHIARTHRIAMDAKGQYLVTGSDDKTARVWSLPDGNLLNVLRPPIGEGDEGKIFAVALSPDSQTVAVGGWTGCNKNGKNCSIYFFNRTSGELQHRLTGLPSTIVYLVYSTDGRYLVASSFGKGIRIYETEKYTQVAQNSNYSDSSYRAEFDAQGRLVTSSFDGFIRLYDQNFKLLAKQPAPGGKRPYAVRFSPKGDKIAVGFADSNRINVLSGQDLTFLYSLPTQEPSNNSSVSIALVSVAWTADGRGLVAGGRYEDGTPILHWADAGQGSRSQWPGAFRAISYLRALPDGQIVFGAADPVFGVLSAQGKKLVYRSAEIADFRGIFRGSFQLSANGDQVQFGYERGGKQPAQFSLKTHTLTSSVTSIEDGAPRTTAPGLVIAYWENIYVPHLNGKPLSLEPNEESLSLSIAPDGQQFLLGTKWYLRLFNQKGQQKWKVPVPDVAWGVKIAGNGQVAVAALADSTIRWYRLQDGQELLALFPHNDKKRWVLWTPQGYYDASPGAENLMGWHINQGPDKEAKFIPFGELPKEFRRPDVLEKVLETLDVEKAVELANAKRN